MTLRLDITHVGLGMEFKELPFNSSLSLGDLKMKLYPRTGTEAKDQLLTLIHPGPERVLDDDKSSLESLGLTDGCRISLVDTNDSSMSNNLDVGASKVEKYEAKSGNAGFAAFRKKSKSPPATNDTEKLEAEALDIGMRVISKKSKKVGTIRFIGQIEPLPLGWWIGVELDDESGKNDGEVKGVRLFQCAPKKGAVMRPSQVETYTDEGKAASKEDDESDTEL